MRVQINEGWIIKGVLHHIAGFSREGGDSWKFSPLHL